MQDTTFFNYTAHPQVEGLGEIGKKDQHQRGFGMHTTLALTPEGLPLGVLNEAFFTRPIGEPAHTPQEVHKLPIEDKESYRWLVALEHTLACLPEAVQAVTICDREGDIYELLALADQRQTGLLVAEGQRCWPKSPSSICGTKSSTTGAWGNCGDHGNQKRPPRQATVSLRFFRHPQAARRRRTTRCRRSR